MLKVSPEALERRARKLAMALGQRLPELKAEVERGAGEVGGGALPLQRLPGWVVAVEWPGRGPDVLDALARRGEPPVIGYVRRGKFRLDVRTLTEDEVFEAVESLGRAWMESAAGK
jgi:L-seryl-tRNA(Ser) seleniumtransferase